MLKIGYLDDSPHAIDVFKWAVKQVRKKIELTYFSEYTTLLSVLRKGENFDLFFLDVEMLAVNGFEIAGVLEQSKIPFAFVTNHPDFALRAFEFKAVDYILKPVSPELILRVLNRLPKELIEDLDFEGDLENRDEVITISQDFITSSSDNPDFKKYKFEVKVDNESLFINLDQVIYVRKIDSKVSEFILVSGQKIQHKSPIRNLDEMFQKLNFDRLFRCGLHEIINLNYLKSLKVSQDKASVLLEGNHKLEFPAYRGVILRNYIKQLK